MTSMPNQFLGAVQALAKLADSANAFASKELLDKLKESAEAMPSRYKEEMNKDRNLKLGIVGRVKAGKSSFLNALLFNGEEWLPKAATPMTAALTRITYTTSKPQMVVHFYLREEWERWLREVEEKNGEIEAQANEEMEKRLARPIKYKLPQDSEGQERVKAELKQTLWESCSLGLRAKRELREMAGKTGIVYDNLPGKYDKDRARKIATVEIDASNPKLLRDSIHKYVGAGGQYTPFVSHIELQVNDKRLDGLEIVDTPGLDDPVASRVEVTNKFLKDCDAALLLSSVSHFLGAGATELLSEKMKYLARVYIVGTMMDAGVLEYPERHESFQNAYSNSRGNYCREAADFLDGIQKKSTLPGGMKVSDQPEFVSSIFYSIAQKLKQHSALSDLEKYMQQAFEKRFPDFKSIMETWEDYEAFGAFDAIRDNIYTPIIKEKEAIKLERISSFVEREAATISKSLEELHSDLLARQTELRNGEAEAIKRKIGQLDKALAESREDISNIFNKLEAKSEKIINISSTNIAELISKYEKIDENIEIEDYTETRSKFLLFKEYVDKTRRIRKASTAKTASKITEFLIEAKKITDSNIDKIVPLDDTRQAIMNVLNKDFESVDYEPPANKMKNMVSGIVKKLNVPAVDFSMEETARNALFGKFDDEVTDSEIESLRRELGNQLRTINSKIASQLNSRLEAIKKELNLASAKFVDNLKKELNNHYKNLDKLLSQKEKNLENYKSIINSTNELKDKFVKIASSQNGKI